MAKKSALITARDPRGRQATAMFKAAYNEVALDSARAQGLNGSREFHKELVELIRRRAVPVFEPGRWYQRAIRLAGKANILFAEEVSMRRKGVVYGKENLELLADTLPDAGDLRDLRAGTHLLLPMPPEPITLLGLRTLQAELFLARSGGWYAAEWEAKKWADTETTGLCRWVAFRKTEVLGSLSKTPTEQDMLIPAGERCPYAAEQSWLTTTAEVVRGMRLFTEAWVRTSTLDAGGWRVGVGRRPDGLGVGSWGDVPGPCIGVASAREFQKK